MFKTLHVLFSRRRAKPTKWLDGSLHIALELIEALKDGSAGTDDRLVDLEAAFEGSCDAFLDEAAGKPELPFYWEELFNASAGIRRLFQLLLSYAALSRMSPTRHSFLPLLEVQARLLGNAREFFREHLGNRKYSRELLRGNQYELKELRRLRLQGVASLGREGQDAQQALRLLGLFDELAAADAALQDCLEKVYIATSL
jgi:hypothetical protein